MTRMWRVNTEFLCRNHLLGEHKELHQLVGSLRKNRSIQGHIEKGQVEVHKIKIRHKELVQEFKKRGYKHNSKILKFKETKSGKINIKNNIREIKKPFVYPTLKDVVCSWVFRFPERNLQKTSHNINVADFFQRLKKRYKNCRKLIILKQK